MADPFKDNIPVKMPCEENKKVSSPYLYNEDPFLKNIRKKSDQWRYGDEKVDDLPWGMVHDDLYDLEEKKEKKINAPKKC